MNEQQPGQGLLEEPSGTAIPIVVVAGRPNVGKSTLVNRIVGRRAAIVEEHPGVTRDRFELPAEWRGRDFLLVDTGGVVDRGDALDEKVTAQALKAVGQADVILFVLDAVTGPTVEDELVAAHLRHCSDRVLVVANKVDSDAREIAAWELAALGFGDPMPVSAMHGRGVGDLLDVIVSRFPASEQPLGPPEAGGSAQEDDDEEGSSEPPVPATAASVAIIGRPNVGKSTLFNRLIGDERSVVHDVPGTTRDAIDTIMESELGPIRLIDTAGLRRKSRIDKSSEYYTLVRSLAAIDHADVSLLVIDASQGVTHQDQRLAERIDAAGSPVVVLLNKWDLLGTEQRLTIAEDVADRLGFLAYAPVIRISAQSGFGVHRLVPALRAAIDAYHRRIPTAQLNQAMRAIQAAHPHPGARILYAAQGAVDPPTVTLFANRRLDQGYLRYIERSLRERFALGPTALKLRVRLRGRG